MTDVTRERVDIRDLAGARVLVLGAGVSGPGAVRILHALGAEPVVADSRPEAVELLRGALPDGVACTGVGLDRAADAFDVRSAMSDWISVTLACCALVDAFARCTSDQLG